MRDEGDVPSEVVEQLHQICTTPPEVREETAWIGVRWRVRRATFAHVLMIRDGSPPAYASAARLNGPVRVLTFRTIDRLFQPSRFDEQPFFRPRWFPNIMGLVLEPPLDWWDVGDLLRESYRVVAPKRLARIVESQS